MLKKFFAVLFVAIAAPAAGQVDARMFRYPAVSADTDRIRLRRRHLAGAEKGRHRGSADLVARRGVVPALLARRDRRSPTAPTTTATLTSTSSPVAGGEPTRLTYHPMTDRVIGWPPDGKRVLFASARESGRQRYSQFYTVGLEGGLPEKLPVPYGEFGAFSPDGDAVRLHADVAGLPQLEAISRRLGAGPLAVRSEDVRVAEHHQQSGQRRAADVARQHDLFHLRPRRERAQQHLGDRHGHRRRRVR